MKINIKQAEKLAELNKINLEVINFSEWHYGLNVELEHGKKLGLITNITNDNISTTVKIVMAHLIEFPDYYKRLQKLENSADKYWSKKKKPSIFL